MHGFNNSNVFVLFAIISLVLSMSFWWRDVISEGKSLLKNPNNIFKGTKY